MSSFRRIISSRANGALSAGPKTDAGKRRSSQNARRHGCRSRTFLCPKATYDPNSTSFKSILFLLLNRAHRKRIPTCSKSSKPDGASVACGKGKP